MSARNAKPSAAAAGSLPVARHPLARLALFALAGLVAGDLPAWLHGAPTSWVWSAFSALACALAAALARRWPRCHGGDMAMLVCMAAVSAGMVLDFMRVPPASLLSLCSSVAGMGVPALLVHVRWFPLTMLAMLLLICVPYRPRAQREQRSVALSAAVLGMLVAFPCMLLVMALWMNAGKAIAAMLGWPWTANGMVSLMLTGMLAYAWLRAAVATRLLGRWQPAPAAQSSVRR